MGATMDWRVVGWYTVVDDTNRLIATCEATVLGYERVADADEMGRNASLIAGAPELLKALKLQQCPRPENAAPDGLTVEECMALGECDCDSGDAIRKATGADPEPSP